MTQTCRLAPDDVARFGNEVAHWLDPGRRLIEPAAGAGYSSGIPAAFQARQDAWLVLVTHHVFGSEELSMHSPGVAQLAPQLYIGLNRAGAQRLGLREGQDVEATPEEAGSNRSCLPLKLMPSLPDGLAAMPAGLSELAGLALPAWYRLRAV